MPLTEAEKGYIAGIIDGEGSIMLQRSGARASSGHIFPVIKVANTNAELMRWLTEKIGAGKVQYRSRSHEKCRDVYHWTIASNQAFALIEQIRPYLVMKAKQAEAMMALRAENEAAVALTGKKAFGHGNSIPAWLRHFREALFFFVRDLNRRGINGRSFRNEIRYHIAASSFEEARLCR